MRSDPGRRRARRRAEGRAEDVGAVGAEDQGAGPFAGCGERGGGREGGTSAAAGAGDQDGAHGPERYLCLIDCRTAPGGCSAAPTSPRLHALLQPRQRPVDDDLLGLPLDHAQHRDLDVDGELVRDLGRGRSGRLQEVRAVERTQHLGLDQGPGDLVPAGPGVREHLVVLDRSRVHDEPDLLGAALGVRRQDLRLLHLAGPVRVAGKVGDHRHDVGRCRLDRDARAGVFRHRRGSSRCGPVLMHVRAA